MKSKLVFCSVVLVLLLPISILAKSEKIVPTPIVTTFSPEASANSQIVPLEDVQRFTNAISQIKTFYVKDVSDQEIFDNAITGMLESLDPHSAYLKPEDFKELKSITSGEFGGLGIEVDMKDGLVRVVTPLDDTPAYQAGLQPGDLIFKINDSLVKGMKMKDAIQMMRGKIGSMISLGIIREGETKPLKIDLVRDVIRVKSVKNKLLESGYGYVRVSNFQESTGKEVKAAIRALDKDKKSPLKGVVLDLRNNPGGLLDTAIEVSDVFLNGKKGLGYHNLIVYTKGRVAGAKYEARAKSQDLLAGKPLVVLINEGSASASEIVAGALQDHGRAVIVGNKSFGKGSVQTVLPLDDTHAIKLTTALYYTPAGRSIQAEGIAPDVVVDRLKVPTKTPDAMDLLLDVSEAQLIGHVDNPTDHKSSAKGLKAPSLQAKKSAVKEMLPDNLDGQLVHKDFQLYQALNVLKGMTVRQS